MASVSSAHRAPFARALWLLAALLCTSQWATFCFALSTINHTSPNKPIPITVLSGFLGSGKTTLLQNLLENNEGLRIAVIVNDVASVNIDSKLVKGTNAAAGMVELQNGCACCSLSEELLASVSELVTLSDMKGDDGSFEHIVIELSGVADPKSVRAKFQEAVLYDMPLMERVSLDTMVTLVDCSTFLEHLKSAKIATPDETPELFYREGEERPTQEDWMEDFPAPLLEALQAGERAYSSGVEENGVADLLVSQTETSDVVVMNKVDLVDDDTRLTQIEQIVKALNPRGRTVRSSFGKLPPQSILAVAAGRGAVEAGVVDDHHDAVDATADKYERVTGHSHVHDHDCHDPDCSDPSHTHSHEHESSAAASSCDDPACDDPTHDHSHQHQHDVESCDDPNCTDPSHSHSHDHLHAGIGTFVYRARRPFHPGRLISFLRHLPVERGLPPANADEPEIPIKSSTKDTLRQVLRSKGFMWCADSNLAAMFWSHAGSSVELSVIGRWWAALEREMWPKEAVQGILRDFDDADHDENDPKSDSVGDRRQEIVFIGQQLGQTDNQIAIGEALDQCLLDDSEWSFFQENKSDENALRTAFSNSIEARVMTF